MTTWGQLTNEQKLEVARLHGKENKSWAELSKKYGIDIGNFSTFKRKAQQLIKKDVQQVTEQSPLKDKVIALLLQRPYTLLELCNRFDTSPNKIQDVIEALKNEHHPIESKDNTVELPAKPNGHTLKSIMGESLGKICWAEMADTHNGSRYAQKSAVNSFIDTAYEKYNVRHVLHSGDATAGTNVYRGQSHELYATSAMEQADDFCNSIPEKPGLDYYAIQGNHDYSFYKSAGLDILSLIASQRKDIIHAGCDEARISLVDGIDVMLWHPSGGVPYAVSYRGQRYVTELSGSELMDLVVGEKTSPSLRFVQIGHLHILNLFVHGPTYVSQAGCFEGTNGYLKAKGLRPFIGGIIWTAEISTNKMVLEATPHILNYPEIPDDYRNHRVPMTAPLMERRLDTLFSMKGE